MNIFTGHYVSFTGRVRLINADLDDIRLSPRGYFYFVDIETDAIISISSVASIESGLQTKLMELYPELFI